MIFPSPFNRKKDHTSVHTASATDIGGKKNNEDKSLIIDKGHKLYSGENKGLLFAVADGMGGHRSGEHASEIAINTLREYYSLLNKIESEDDTLNILAELFEKANRLIYSEGNKNSDYFGMGTTLTVLVIRQQRYFISQVGDSRCYLLRSRHLQQLTEDHSVVGQLLQMGQITKDEVALNPMRHQLLKYLGSEKKALPQLRKGDIKENDIFLLCSDGLTDEVPDDIIYKILHEQSDPENVCKQLIKRAIGAEREGKDNVTALVAKVA